jgi:hypothetical protein
MVSTNERLQSNVECRKPPFRYRPPPVIWVLPVRARSGSNLAVQANDPTATASGSTARIAASGIRHDDRLNVGTQRAEWYASSHSLGSERLREWYTCRVHVAPQQYTIWSMPSGFSAPSREVTHGEY